VSKTGNTRRSSLPVPDDVQCIVVRKPLFLAETAQHPTQLVVLIVGDPLNGDHGMKMRNSILTFSLLALSSLAQAADPHLARNLAATCANCHGTNGYAVEGAGMDRLAGMDKGKILQKLADYKNDNKPATIMHQIAKGYTDAQLDLIASYFAAQK
jgi:cytochrome c553